MKGIILFLVFVITTSFYGVAQTGDLSGLVLSNKSGLPYVKVMLKDITKGAITNEDGGFTITDIPIGVHSIIVNVIGFEGYEKEVLIEKGKTLDLNIDLTSRNLSLNEIVVTGTMRQTMVSNSPVKIEVLNRAFFSSNPVNSVIEALETVNGVQEQVNCGVCGTNDIHINGMEGPYTLVLIDGMPIVSGLSSVYGFNGIPTSLIDRVEIIKGPSSTLYGTEAVGGVVNIITKSPEKSQLINTELRYSSHDELKVELSISPKIGKNVSMSLSGDFYNNQRRLDYNKDGFTDIPLNNRFSLFNKWQINNKKGQKAFHLGARYLTEDRFGGQLNWQKSDRGSSSVYGESILTERFELIGSYILPTKKRKVRLDFSANRHRQNSFYGATSYNAVQDVFFTNLIWEKKLGNRNFLVSGMSNKYLIYSDNTPSKTDEKSYIPGVFIQNEFKWTEDFTVLAGGRLDHHQRHGLIFAPRISVKKTFKDFTTLRLNYGTGFRQVFLFTEDHAFVSGARDVIIKNDLNPEQSHNVTFNLNHTYSFGRNYGNVDMDIFYTYFSNKIIPDFDTDPNLIIYDNLSGFSISRGVSLAVNHKFKIPLRVKLGTTFMDVFEQNKNELTNEIEKEQQIFAPTFSGVFSVEYNFKKMGLVINYSGKVVGKQRLPTFAEGFERPEYSNWFSLQHVQLTKAFKKSDLELFAGVKNILNYTQNTPLIDPENPFSDSFDTSYAYGPLQVRRFYLGVRYGINRKKTK